MHNDPSNYCQLYLSSIPSKRMSNSTIKKSTKCESDSKTLCKSKRSAGKRRRENSENYMSKLGKIFRIYAQMGESSYTEKLRASKLFTLFNDMNVFK